MSLKTRIRRLEQRTAPDCSRVQLASMPKARSPQLPAVTPPAPHRALFGPLLVLEGEDAAAYDALLERVAGAVDPADVLEEIWVRDVVDLAWDALRLRRLKASLMTAASHEGLESVLTPLLESVRRL